jgi:hypothetical protein
MKSIFVVAYLSFGSCFGQRVVTRYAHSISMIDVSYVGLF